MAADDIITVKIRLRDGALFAAEARKASKEIDHLGDSADRASRKATGMSSSFELVNKSVNLLKWPAIIAGVGLLGQTLSAVTAGGVGLVGALSPLVGLLGTLPALAVLAGQGLGVTTLGLKGVTDALGGLNGQIDPKKFAMLQRPAQDFVLALDKMKQPVLALQRAVQAGLLPGLQAGLQAALPAVKALTAPLAGTARVLGLFAARLGTLVGSSGFLKDLRSQAYFNNIQLTRFAGVGLHLVNIFRNLMVASRPLVSALVQLVAGWAASADKATAAGRASGGLQRGFHAIQVTTFRVVRIIKDLAVALFNIGRIGKHALGDQLLVSLVHGADQLQRWTQSGPGIAKITKFFADARPVLSALGLLLKDTATQLFRFTSGSEGGLIGVLGTFDSFVKILGTLSRIVGPDTVVYAFLGGKLLIGGIKAMSLLSDGISGATKAWAFFTGGQFLMGAGVLIGRVRGALAAFRVWLIGESAATGTAAGVAQTEGMAAGATSAGALSKLAGAGSLLGGKFGLAFKAAGAIGVGLLFDSIAKKIPALSQYSGKKGWGELWKDTKHDLGGIGGFFSGIAHKALPGAAAGGLIRTPGQFLIGEQGPELWTMLPGMGSARVDPLPSGGHVPMMTGGRTQPIVVHSVLQLPDGRVVAEAVDHVFNDDDLRA